MDNNARTLVEEQTPSGKSLKLVYKSSGADAR
jgi:hypothetical protein